ncbi:MAG: hypothetical protein IJ459_00625 [Clostridia bacterium]|nr:hypothetical protein [Clostridia bacterium]
MAYLLSLPLILLILLTRYTKVRFIVFEGLRVEITFTLFTLDLTDFGSSKKKKRRPFSFYRDLISTIADFVEQSEVVLERLAVPRSPREPADRVAYTSPYRYHIAISSLIAYIEAKAKKLNVRDNAVILIPDGDEELSLILTVKSRLYQVARYAAKIWYLHIKSKKQEERKYVGK